MKEEKSKLTRKKKTLRGLKRMERLRNELKEEMIRKCKKETLEQPSLGRWARGEGGLEWDHQEDKEDKDCLISFLSCTVYSVQCTMYTLIPLSLVKANAPQTKLIACRTHVWEIKHIFWHFANLTTSLTTRELPYLHVLSVFALGHRHRYGQIFKLARLHDTYTTSVLGDTLCTSLFLSSFGHFFLFQSHPASPLHILLLLILILLLLLYAFDQPRWLVHSWPGAQV